MAKRLEQAITEAEKQRQIGIAYNLYVSARKMLIPPDRGVFAMGFAMGMRRGYALAQNEGEAIERSLMQGMNDGQ